MTETRFHKDTFLLYQGYASGEQKKKIHPKTSVLQMLLVLLLNTTTVAMLLLAQCFVKAK